MQAAKGKQSEERTNDALTNFIGENIASDRRFSVTIIIVIIAAAAAAAEEHWPQENLA